MPPFIYQNVINLGVFPSEEVQVYLWMLHCGIIVLLTRFFVANFTALTPLSLLISCKLSFPSVGLKYLLSLLLHWNLLTKCLCGTSGTDWINALILHKSYPLYHYFYSDFVHAQSEQYHMDISSVIYNILSLINSTLTADIVPLCMIMPVPKWW